MHQYRRHTLLTISEPARRAIFDKAVAGGMDPGLCGQMLLTGIAQDSPLAPAGRRGAPLPGIVRRDTLLPSDTRVPVGFTSWESGPMGRLRLPAFVEEADVVDAADPFEVLARAMACDGLSERTPAQRALRALAGAGGACAFHGATLGVWGSVGMELATGYAYAHEGSDLDIILLPREPLTAARVQGWASVLADAERAFGARVDADIRLPGGYDVSLKECAAAPRQVLAKGTADVVLMPLSLALGSV